MVTEKELVFIDKEQEISRFSHGFVTASLIYLFVHHVKTHRLTGSVVDDLDVIFPKSGARLRPDIAYISRRLSEDELEESYKGVPELIVEIISEPSMIEDTLTKKNFYAGEGVQEYWIVIPTLKSIYVYELKESKYILLQVASETGIIRSKVLTNLEIPVEEVFYRS